MGWTSLASLRITSGLSGVTVPSAALRPDRHRDAARRCILRAAPPVTASHFGISGDARPGISPNPIWRFRFLFPRHAAPKPARRPTLPYSPISTIRRTGAGDAFDSPRSRPTGQGHCSVMAGMMHGGEPSLPMHRGNAAGGGGDDLVVKQNRQTSGQYKSLLPAAMQLRGKGRSATTIWPAALVPTKTQTRDLTMLWWLVGVCLLRRLH